MGFNKLHHDLLEPWMEWDLTGGWIRMPGLRRPANPVRSPVLWGGPGKLKPVPLKDHGDF
jgi:hypothetical protein